MQGKSRTGFQDCGASKISNAPGGGRNDLFRFGAGTGQDCDPWLAPTAHVKDGLLLSRKTIDLGLKGERIEMLE